MNKKNFSENCNLSSYTTIKVGGVAEYFAEPRNLDEFSYLIKWANLNKQRCQIIGAVSYTHLRAHETLRHLVCRLLLEKKK